jgi:cation transport ATPase
MFCVCLLLLFVDGFFFRSESTQTKTVGCTAARGNREKWEFVRKTKRLTTIHEATQGRKGEERNCKGVCKRLQKREEKKPKQEKKEQQHTQKRVTAQQRHEENTQHEANDRLTFSLLTFLLFLLWFASQPSTRGIWCVVLLAEHATFLALLLVSLLFPRRTKDLRVVRAGEKPTGANSNNDERRKGGSV